MRSSFSNQNPVEIAADRPATIRSIIEVTGLSGSVSGVEVTVRVDHTFTRDLIMVLQSPGGQRVLLVADEGGAGDDFAGTTFADDADRPISGAAAPFRGRFRPEGSLSALDGEAANGSWSLLIADTANLDGGSLLGWDLSLVSSDSDTSSTAGAPLIDIRFLGGLSASQQATFTDAANRWSEVIVGSLPDVIVSGERISGVRIDAQGISIDGPSGVLGQAGPRTLRPGSLLPATGVMQFDINDLGTLEAEGGLTNVIIHEMGHVLGIGTLWEQNGLLSGAGTANPVFLGAGAQAEFGTLVGAGGARPVPVANTGGPGTRDGHWREAVFGSELMTGFLNAGINPLSRLTAASLADLGYEVSFDAVDEFALPSALELAILGVGASDSALGRCCTLDRGRMPAPIVLPSSALV